MARETGERMTAIATPTQSAGMLFSEAELSAASCPPFRFVDLFAGIGGIRMGLQRAGGRCVYTVEIDKFASQTYGANFAPVDAADVRGVDPSELPPYDLLAAGFPCQPFSLAGVSKKVSLGREHGFAEAKSGNLFFEIERIIRDARAKPRVLFLENVKHLTRHDGGNTFRTIQEKLDDLGYTLSWRVIDARPWVPQHRERTYMVGLLRDVYGETRFEFPESPSAVAGPKLGSILEPDAPAKYTLTPGLWTYLQAYARKHREAGNGFGYGLADPTMTTRTLSARYHKDGSEILVDEGRERPRRLTPRECARLMGYPENFKIPVSDTQAYRQFGNSVAVPVIEFIAKELATQVAIRASNPKRGR